MDEYNPDVIYDLFARNDEADVILTKINEHAPLAVSSIVRLLTLTEKCLSTPSARDTETTLQSNLNKCFDILESLVFAMRYIIENSSEHSGVDLLCDLPKSLAHVVLSIFQHCKHSEAIYASYFKNIGANITKVFKKNYEVQQLYFIILCDHITFDRANLDELVEVLAVLRDIGEVVFSLDVKSITEQWKGYLKLCERYSHSLKAKFVHDKTVQILCHEMRRNLDLVTAKDAIDSKEATRAIKINSFILKILLKICKENVGYVSKNYDYAVSFLSHFYRMTSSENIRAKILTLVPDFNLELGLNLIVKCLIHDNHFQDSFMQNKSMVHDASLNVGYLLLCLKIIKLSLSLNDDMNDKWLHDVIHLFLIIIDEYPMAVFINSNDGDLEGQAITYKHCLINIGCLMLKKYDSINFEAMLLECIFKFKIWKSMLAFDLWILMARCSTPELCFEQFTYLVMIFEECKHFIKNTPQEIFLSNLLSQIYCLLSESYEIKIYKEYTINNHIELWTAIGLHCIPIEILSEHDVFLKTTLTGDICRKLAKPDDLIQLNGQMQLYSSLFIDDDDSIMLSIKTNLVELWKMVICTGNILNRKETCAEHSQWLYDFVGLLCQTTCNIVPFLGCQMWTDILICLSTCMLNANSFIKICTLQVLQRSFTYLNIIELDEGYSLSSFISTIFKSLLNDENILISTIATEMFMEFTFSTVNKCIVENVIKSDKKIKAKITMLLSGNHSKCSEKKSTVTNVVFSHKCEQSENYFPPKNDEELTCHIEALKDKAVSLQNVAASLHVPLNDVQRNEVKSVVDLLNVLIAD